MPYPSAQPPAWTRNDSHLLAALIAEDRDWHHLQRAFGRRFRPAHIKERIRYIVRRGWLSYFSELDGSYHASILWTPRDITILLSCIRANMSAKNVRPKFRNRTLIAVQSKMTELKAEIACDMPELGVYEDGGDPDGYGAEDEDEEPVVDFGGVEDDNFGDYGGGFGPGGSIYGTASMGNSSRGHGVGSSGHATPSVAGSPPSTYPGVHGIHRGPFGTRGVSGHTRGAERSVKTEPGLYDMPPSRYISRAVEDLGTRPVKREKKEDDQDILPLPHAKRLKSANESEKDDSEHRRLVLPLLPHAKNVKVEKNVKADGTSSHNA